MLVWGEYVRCTLGPQYEDESRGDPARHDRQGLWWKTSSQRKLPIGQGTADVGFICRFDEKLQKQGGLGCAAAETAV